MGVTEVRTWGAVVFDLHVVADHLGFGVDIPSNDDLADLLMEASQHIWALALKCGEATEL